MKIKNESRSFRVYDAMTTNPVTIDKNATLQTAALLMIDNKVASLVVKENSKFLGLLTEKDMVRKSVAQNLDASKTHVKDIMKTRVITISANDELVDAVKKIGQNGQKQLPVLEGENLVGFLTFKDIMKVQPSLFGLIYGTYNIREEARKPVYSTELNEGVCSMCGDFSCELALEEDEEELCPECKNVLN